MNIIYKSTNDERQEPITDAIVAAVAEAEETDVFELPPLWDAIDPDALELLFAPTSGRKAPAGRIVFNYCDYEVTVTTGSSISVSID